MAYGGMMVFSGSACPKLAASIAQYLDQPLGKVVVDRFSDGEAQVEVIDNVRGKDVFILQSDKLAIAYPRPFATVELAKTGDAEKRLMLVEYGLKVSNEAAHGIAADLTTA